MLLIDPGLRVRLSGRDGVQTRCGLAAATLLFLDKGQGCTDVGMSAEVCCVRAGALQQQWNFLSKQITPEDDSLIADCASLQTYAVLAREIIALSMTV